MKIIDKTAFSVTCEKNEMKFVPIYTLWVKNRKCEYKKKYVWNFIQHMILICVNYWFSTSHHFKYLWTFLSRGQNHKSYLISHCILYLKQLAQLVLQCSKRILNYEHKGLIFTDWLRRIARKVFYEDYLL